MVLSQMSDEQLMERVCAKDHSALEHLLDRHGSSVYGYCMRMFHGNQATVEDITQEVWLSVVRNACKYSSTGHFKAWLMTITRNAAISAVRKELPAHRQDDAEEVEIASDFDLESELLKRYDLAEIRSAVDALVSSQRAVFLLWLEEDASYESIGKKLGLPFVSVRSILCRARENIRRRLEKK